MGCSNSSGKRLVGKPVAGRRRSFASLAVIGAMLAPSLARAQSVDETVSLEAGWNAVWLNVTPEPNDLIQFLASQSPPLDVQSIWTFEPNRDSSADPSVEAPGRWLMYDKRTPASMHTLQTLQGHRSYLIQVNVGGALHLSGRPIIRAFSFNGRVSNLFGALSDTPGPPMTFERFFAHPTAAGKIVSIAAPLKHDIFALSEGNLVRRELTDVIGANQAFWVNTTQDFTHAGPLDATASANGLAFGRTTAMRTLTITVPASQFARTVRLQAYPCLQLGGGDCSAIAGGAEWLEYRVPASTPVPQWLPLTSGLDVVISPGATSLNLELRARRAALSIVTSGADGSGSLPPLVIEVTDDQGARVVIPSDVAVEPIFGLWGGSAVLTHVSAHTSIQEIPLADAAAPPLEMALILDLPSPDETAGGSAPRLLDTVTIQTFRDGRSLLRRLSSVLFDRPVDLIEDAGQPLDRFGASGVLRGSIHILPEDPLNPYRHRYHPEHRSGFEITREVTLELVVAPPDTTDELAGLDGTFGPHRLTGTYTEVITGLVAGSITVRGSFRMERLNEGGGQP